MEAEHSEEIEKFGRGGIVREVKVYVKLSQDTQVARQSYSGQGGQRTGRETWRAIQREEMKCYVL